MNHRTAKPADGSDSVGGAHAARVLAKAAGFADFSGDEHDAAHDIISHTE
jgi:hypothetical protein